MLVNGLFLSRLEEDIQCVELTDFNQMLVSPLSIEEDQTRNGITLENDCELSQ